MQYRLLALTSAEYYTSLGQCAFFVFLFFGTTKPSSDFRLQRRRESNGRGLRTCPVVATRENGPSIIVPRGGGGGDRLGGRRRRSVLVDVSPRQQTGPWIAVNSLPPVKESYGLDNMLCGS